MTTATHKQLCAAVIDMDGLSQYAFSQIDAISSLAIKSLETPNFRIEHIKQALIAIRDTAFSTQGCISYEAEEVGCQYDSDADRTRTAIENGIARNSSISSSVPENAHSERSLAPLCLFKGDSS